MVKGDGLSLPLNQFDVSLVPGRQSMLLATREKGRHLTPAHRQRVIPAAGSGINQYKSGSLSLI